MATAATRGASRKKKNDPGSLLTTRGEAGALAAHVVGEYDEQVAIPRIVKLEARIVALEAARARPWWRRW